MLVEIASHDSYRMATTISMRIEVSSQKRLKRLLYSYRSLASLCWSLEGLARLGRVRRPNLEAGHIVHEGPVLLPAHR
jgi:hypothetical protein